MEIKWKAISPYNSCHSLLPSLLLWLICSPEPFPVPTLCPAAGRHTTQLPSQRVHGLLPAEPQEQPSEGWEKQATGTKAYLRGLVKMKQLHKQTLCAFPTLAHGTGKMSSGALEEHGLRTAGKTPTRWGCTGPVTKTYHAPYTNSILTL